MYQALMAEKLRANLGIEPEWSEPLANGFVWWPSEFSQRFSFEPIVAGEDETWVRSSVDTEWLRDIEPARTSIAELTSDMFNAQPVGGSAYVDQNRVRLTASLITEPRTHGSAATWLADSAMLQGFLVWRNLHNRPSNSGTETRQIEPDRSNHPTRGRRSDLTAGYRSEFRRVLATTGPTAEHVVDLDALARHLADIGVQEVSGGSRDRWIGSSETLARPGADQYGDASPRSAAAFEAITRLDLGIRHPVVGESLVARCVIAAPRHMPASQCYAWAKQFNTAERSSDKGPTLRLGAWTYQPDHHRWVHASNHPLEAMDPTFPRALAIASVERGRWWLNSLGPELAASDEPN